LALALENYSLAAAGVLIALLALRFLGAIERKMGQKCRISLYEVTALEDEGIVRAVHQEVGNSHFPEGPLSLDRQNGTIRMRFGFCNPPSRHQEFVETLRRMPALIDMKME
jgi:hypothetical protein